MGTVSPAILVPAMVSLNSNGYGKAKSIPTILIAASSFNDILAIKYKLGNKPKFCMSR